MMKVAISQPRYLPALNYLQRILISDKFILLDDVQHQRRAFEHRNQVRDKEKAYWLSIPIDRTSTSRPLIKDMQIADPEWVNQHKRTINSYYIETPFFNSNFLDDLYKDMTREKYFVNAVEKQLFRTLEFLRIPSRDKIIHSSSLNIKQSGSQLLSALTKAIGGDTYISGPNGRNYIDMKYFTDVQVLYHDFDFPNYKQQGNQFIPWLAWIDSLFNAGIDKTNEFITNNVRLSDI